MRYLILGLALLTLATVGTAEAKRNKPVQLAAFVGGVECSVTPDPVAAFGDVSFHCEGFAPYYTASFVVQMPVGLAVMGNTINENGAVDYGPFHTSVAGTYTLTAFTGADINGDIVGDQVVFTVQ